MKKRSVETGNPAKIRQLNRKAVLSYMREKQLSSRIELIQHLNLAPATISSVVGDLVDENVLLEVTLPSDNKRNPGRPSRKIKLNPNVAFVLGISLRIERNILYIDAAYANYCGDISVINTRIFSDIYPSSTSTYEAILQALKQVVETLVSALPEGANIIGLGIGIPGVVNNNCIEHAPNLSDIEGDRLYRDMTALVDYPVFLENDVNLLVIAKLEKKPELRELNISYIFISQGVGAGTALNNTLWRSSGWSGEIGHIMVPFEGELRALESLIGCDGHFSQQLSEYGVSMTNSASWSSSKMDMPQVQNIVYHYVNYLSLAIQMLNGTFDLDKVVINLSNEPMLEYCMPMLNDIMVSSPLTISVESDTTGQNVVAQGAAFLALRRAIAL